ncbi:hypothetical protein DFH09DRAFT_1282669 [Mycena vulgaris]|nr:hypothetical protein DFH09DRAFT_1282669 [Mycena vulgaris]
MRETTTRARCMSFSRLAKGMPDPPFSFTGERRSGARHISMPAAGGDDGASASFSWAAEAMLSGDCACAAFIARADGRAGQISCDLRSFASRCGLSMRRVGVEPERETTGQCSVVLRAWRSHRNRTRHAPARRLRRADAARLGKGCGGVKEAARQLGRTLARAEGIRPFWEADDVITILLPVSVLVVLRRGAGVYAACAAVVGDGVNIGVVVDIGAFVFALGMLAQVSVSEYLLVLRREVNEWRVPLLDAPARTDAYSAILCAELELEPGNIEEKDGEDEEPASATSTPASATSARPPSASTRPPPAQYQHQPEMKIKLRARSGSASATPLAFGLDAPSPPSSASGSEGPGTPPASAGMHMPRHAHQHLQHPHPQMYDQQMQQMQMMTGVGIPMAMPFEKFEPMPVHLGVGMGAAMGMAASQTTGGTRSTPGSGTSSSSSSSTRRPRALGMGMGLYEQQTMLMNGGGGAHEMMGSGVGVSAGVGQGSICTTQCCSGSEPVPLVLPAPALVPPGSFLELAPPAPTLLTHFPSIYLPLLFLSCFTLLSFGLSDTYLPTITYSRYLDISPHSLLVGCCTSRRLAHFPPPRAIPI